jgi:hypothetical protein
VPQSDDYRHVCAGVTFGHLAPPLIAGGVLRYYLLHTALPSLPEALSNLGFGRTSAFGVQPAAARRRSSAVAVRIAGIEHLSRGLDQGDGGVLPLLVRPKKGLTIRQSSRGIS